MVYLHSCATVTCRRCGRTGHLSYNCPQPADVHALDEDWVLSVDHTEEVAAYHAAHSDIVEQEARAAAMEDFGNGRERQYAHLFPLLSSERKDRTIRRASFAAASGTTPAAGCASS
ncbi:hypothetical protein EV714DRAFT_278337 [Schizophyllum commune]